MVVDDERLNRVMLSVNLQNSGCTVATAENGAQALEILQSEPLDIVLLDLMMPEMDGFEVLSRLQADARLRDLPVIVISAEDDQDSVVRCIEMGAADYLPKPFNPVLLQARGQSCLEKKRARDRELELFAALQTRCRELEERNQTIREQSDLLKELSIRDPLTGLYNRRHFDEHAEALFAQAVRYKQPLSFAIADADYFKKINDQFTHAVGDEVLRHIAAILRSKTRQSDIAARYGGEEFVVALPHTSLEPALTLCEKLRAEVESHPWHSLHPELRVTMSLGVCDSLQLGTWSKVMAAADKSLYQAKSAGRNRVCACEEPKL